MRDHLSIVSHWAREQLRDGANTPAAVARLTELIEVAELTRADLPVREPEFSDNVVVLKKYRHAQHKRTA